MPIFGYQYLWLIITTISNKLPSNTIKYNDLSILFNFLIVDILLEMDNYIFNDKYNYRCKK